MLEGELLRELSTEWPSVGTADSGESEGESCSVAGERVRGARRLLSEIRTRNLVGPLATTGGSGCGSTLPWLASWMLFRLPERVGTIGMNPGLGFGLFGRLFTVLVELLARGS